MEGYYETEADAAKDVFEYAEGDFEIKVNPIEEKIKSINPLEMTPMEALLFLYELNKEVKDKK